MPYNLPNPALDRKVYRAEMVRAMIVNAYKEAYVEGKADGNKEAETLYQPKRLERDRLRLQVAHELITVMQTIIDP